MNGGLFLAFGEVAGVEECEFVIYFLQKLSFGKGISKGGAVAIHPNFSSRGHLFAFYVLPIGHAISEDPIELISSVLIACFLAILACVFQFVIVFVNILH